MNVSEQYHMENILRRCLWIKSSLRDVILAVITQASSGICVAEMPLLLARSGDRRVQEMILRRRTFWCYRPSFVVSQSS